MDLAARHARQRPGTLERDALGHRDEAQEVGEVEQADAVQIGCAVNLRADEGRRSVLRRDGEGTRAGTQDARARRQPRAARRAHVVGHVGAFELHVGRSAASREGRHELYRHHRIARCYPRDGAPTVRGHGHLVLRDAGGGVLAEPVERSGDHPRDDRGEAPRAAAVAQPARMAGTVPRDRVPVKMGALAQKPVRATVRTRSDAAFRERRSWLAEWRSEGPAGPGAERRDTGEASAAWSCLL